MSTERDLKKEVYDFDKREDLNLFFEDFIKKGIVTSEEEVVPGLKIKVKVLSTGEILSAESIMTSVTEIPQDIIIKVRSASILSQALMTINDIEVEGKDMDSEQIRLRRVDLYKKIMDMSPYVVTKMYDLYIKTVKKQNDLYSDNTLEDTLENFSEHH